jgi:hypothetical protein
MEGGNSTRVLFPDELQSLQSLGQEAIKMAPKEFGHPKLDGILVIWYRRRLGKNSGDFEGMQGMGLVHLGGGGSKKTEYSLGRRTRRRVRCARGFFSSKSTKSHHPESAYTAPKYLYRGLLICAVFRHLISPTTVWQKE